MNTTPDGYHTVTPQSLTPNPTETINFIEAVFGGVVVEKYEDDGVIHHAEMTIGDSRLMLGAAIDDVPIYTLSSHTYVDDVDAAYQRAMEHGATSMREPEDQFYGDRTAVVIDSQGNNWSIATRLEELSQEELQRRFEELDG